MYQYYYFDNKEKADSMYNEIVDLVERSKKKPKRVKVENIINKYWGYWDFDKLDNTYIYEVKVVYDSDEINENNRLVLIEYTHMKKNSKFKKAIPYILIFISGVLFGTCIHIEPKEDKDEDEEKKEDKSQ